MYLITFSLIMLLKKAQRRDFPGSLVVRTLCFHGRGHEFSPWLGRPQPYPHTHTIPDHTHIPTYHAVWSTKQNKTKPEEYNKKRTG